VRPQTDIRPSGIHYSILQSCDVCCYWRTTSRHLLFVPSAGAAPLDIYSFWTLIEEAWQSKTNK
jgi:hypothetical protein